MRFYLALLCATVSIVVAGCNSSSSKTDASGSKPGDSKTQASKLSKLGIDDKVVGKGPKVQNGDEVWVKYTGKLANGSVFDSNDKPDGDPFHLTVGQGTVIKGWDLGLVGMQKGGKRKLSIPSNLGYGDKPMGDKIPPNADLYFDVEMVEILKASEADVITADDVKVGTGKEAKTGDTLTIEYDASAGGKVYETTKELKKPLVLKIGADQSTVRGFDEALVGMKVGGERKVKVPPQMTMTMQNDKLRSNAVTFDVHLVSIK